MSFLSHEALKRLPTPLMDPYKSLDHSGDAFSYISQLVVPINKEKDVFLEVEPLEMWTVLCSPRTQLAGIERGLVLSFVWRNKGDKHSHSKPPASNLVPFSPFRESVTINISHIVM